MGGGGGSLYNYMVNYLSGILLNIFLRCPVCAEKRGIFAKFIGL